VRVNLEALLEPATTVILTQEYQRGIVGPDSALPALAAAAADSGMLAAVGRLVRGARAAGATVLHAVAAPSCLPPTRAGTSPASASVPTAAWPCTDAGWTIGQGGPS